MFERRLFIVFAIEHYNPLGVIRSLGEMGINPVYIAEKGKTEIASSSCYISKCHYVNTVEEGYELLLKEYGCHDSDSRPFLLCTDDHTMGFIDSRYEEIKDKFYVFNAGRNDGINTYIDKANILDIAKECGLNVADTVVCEKERNGWNVPSNLNYPIITKSISPNVGGWKSDVFICKNSDEMDSALEKIKAPKILIQQYIEKKNELEYYGFAINHGEEVFISIAADYMYLIPGYYSPYMNIFNPPYPDIQKKIADMIKKIGFEGIFSVEFLRDDNDELYFLEVNFRIATWCYSSTYIGMNLPYLWAKSMLEGKIESEDKIEFEPFKAMVEPVDYGKRVDTGKISVAEWMKDFKEVDCTYYYNAKDIEPYHVMCNNWNKLK